MNVDDNFYDEISSLLPPPGDYGLSAELDDILGSTVSPLDSFSAELNNFVSPQSHVADFDLLSPLPNVNYTQETPAITDFYQLPAETGGENAFDFNFSAFPSPAASTSTSNSDDSMFNIMRTPSSGSSTSSMDAVDVNLDDLLNFINDDDNKMTDELTCDSLLEHMKHERNTPSPTGSSSSIESSGGSTTSGVHSDASSIASSTTERKPCKKLLSQIDVESAFVEEIKPQIGIETKTNDETTFMFKDEEMKQEYSTITTTTPQLQKTTNATPAINTNILPVITLPTIVTQQQQQSSVTLMPVQRVPLTNGSTGTVTPIKVEPKLASKNQVKLLTTSNISAATKTAPQPTNGKPKTIFLSSNDFKALMQKMNTTNGVKGAKINGSVNAQMPKIIMKTANGKVIAANKIVQPLNTATKFVKASNNNTAAATPSIFVKHNQMQQQPQAAKLLTTNRAAITVPSTRLQATNAAAIAAATTTVGGAYVHKPDHSIYKGMIDEKIYKKQQRMIKNRESASLSRKKKKEYVVSLETRINNLEKENSTLKGENTTLRNQLVAFAKTCNCRHGNVSEFVLNSLNAAAGKTEQHVKIAPKPTARSIKQRITSTTMKKNVAVLFAMAFMVTLNVGNFQNYLNQQNIESDGVVIETIAEEPMATGRRLLWVETEQEFNDKLNRSKRNVEMEVPPLHFLRPVNRTGGNSTTTTTANADSQNYDKANEPPPLVQTARCNGGCANGNQTENLRLASNLHKWIGGNDFLNLSTHMKYGGNELNMNPHGFKVTTDYLDLKNLHGKRKFFMNTDYGNVNNEMATEKRQKIEKTQTDDEEVDDEDGENDLVKKNNNNNNVRNEDNSLKLFKPKIEEEYLRLFKNIKRQDDTFYVLSFNMEHILLSASAYNKSTRPKMSLMLPTGDPNVNGDIMLMKIDCEVFNTTQLELKSHMIPSNLRPPTVRMPAAAATTTKSTDVANNETAAASKPLREKLPLKYPQPKEKPAVRTYFMVGPKNEAAAAASLQKPRIVRYNSSMINATLSSGKRVVAANSGTQPLNVRNSTLFAKMRETVQGEFEEP